ncbi:hypothetical protein T06_4201 [Trichinella sp. T6]|nr:hypothetical protein T06_4201 [Trichinella sp. T6]
MVTLNQGRILCTRLDIALNAIADNRRSRRLTAGRKASRITAATLPRLASQDQLRDDEERPALKFIAVDCSRNDALASLS